MGLASWFRERWLMMLRTKPHYISVLGRKRSSVTSTPKLTPRGEKCGTMFGVFVSLVTMLCSVSYGVLLVLSRGVDSSSVTTYLVSLVIAATAAVLNGLCLAEYMNSESEEVPSVYSFCYQHTSEVLAFFIGWVWILSQLAVIAAACKILTDHINQWTSDVPRKFLEGIFYDYAKDVPSLMFVLIFILFILTGLNETVVWYVFFIPVAFMMIVGVYIIGCAASTVEIGVVDMLNFDSVNNPGKVLSISALCILFFSGPQSLLRTPVAHAEKNTPFVLCSLNAIILVIAFIFTVTTPLLNKLFAYPPSNEMLNLASNVLCSVSLCSVAVEAFHPLHFIVQDMASDGLIFRNFSKKWKPFCFPVSSSCVHLLTFIFIGLMSVCMPLSQVLNLAVVFPLLVGSIIPYLILIRRYKYNNSWQYEPMLHASAKSVHDRSRKQSEEFQYSHTPGFDITEDCEISTACIEEIPTDSNNSDTDIDSVVEQYKEQTLIANLSKLEGPISSNQAPEPTPSSSFKAKLFVIILIIISSAISLVINSNYFNDNISLLILVLTGVLLSTIVQSLLVCLPQNHTTSKRKGCCANVPKMPWTPGMASMISLSLLVHCLLETWKVFLGCFLVGALLYFLYGMRSSTAANSFYNMRAMHITLRPLPSYGNNCIPQIIPAQQKKIKSRKHKKLKTAI